MRFNIPTDIYIEHDCVKAHAKNLLGIGKRALIMTGHSSAKVNGSLGDVETVLKDGGIAYKIFNEVEENPSVETVAKATQEAFDFKANFVIGIGGGSPIDAAKAVALLMANPSMKAENLHDINTGAPLCHAPVVAVPTTCGTGSEATPVSVLTNRKAGFKKSIPHRIFPTLALVDGKYLASAKRELIANTAVDALAHLVESILNNKSNAFNRMCPEYGLKLWGSVKGALLSKASIDASIYETLMLTSTVAGMSIAHTSTAVPHGMSYDLTLNLNVPHGRAVGYFLAAYMRVCEKAVPEDVRTILTLLNLNSVDEFAAMVKALIGTCTVTHEQAQSFAQAMKQNKAKLTLAPYTMTPDDVDAIYEQSLVIKD